MALINCPECNCENVSDSATACPKCGFNIREFIEKQKQLEESKKKTEELINHNLNNNSSLIEELNQKLKLDLESIDNMERPQKESILHYLFLGTDSSILRWLIIILCILLFFGILGQSAFFIVVFAILFIIALPIVVFLEINDYKEHCSRCDKINNDFSGYKQSRKETVIRKYNDTIENIKMYNSKSAPLSNDYHRNIPRCPTCSSTNIQKISTADRAAHGLAFGLFSKTARSQWECKNCGNKW